MQALVVYALWVGATYLFEGLPGTLARPEATAARLAYALVANVALGIFLSLCLIGARLRAGRGAPSDYGFAGAGRMLAGIAAGALAGYALFRLSYPRPVDAVVLANTFAQVWVVSAAEIMVCWSLVGGMLRSALRPRSAVASSIVAVAVASALFGAYHFAHSPPFNEIRMVVFLTAVGLATSAFWLISRDCVGTAVFHNFFGVTGVLGALEARGKLPEHAEPAVSIIITALLAAGLMAWPALRWRQGEMK
jgi:hypothetical protein